MNENQSDVATTSEVVQEQTTGGGVRCEECHAEGYEMVYTAGRLEAHMALHRALANSKTHQEIGAAAVKLHRARHYKRGKLPKKRRSSATPLSSPKASPKAKRRDNGRVADALVTAVLDLFAQNRANLRATVVASLDDDGSVAR